MVFDVSHGQWHHEMRVPAVHCQSAVVALKMLHQQLAQDLPGAGVLRRHRVDPIFRLGPDRGAQYDRLLVGGDAHVVRQRRQRLVARRRGADLRRDSCVLDMARSCGRGAGVRRLQIRGRVGRRVVRSRQLSRLGGHRDGAWKQYRGCRHPQNKKFPVHDAAPVHSKFASPCCARSAAARCQRSSASSRGLSVGCRRMRSLSQEFLRRRPTCLCL